MEDPLTETAFSRNLEEEEEIEAEHLAALDKPAVVLHRPGKSPVVARTLIVADDPVACALLRQACGPETLAASVVLPGQDLSGTALGGSPGDPTTTIHTLPGTSGPLAIALMQYKVPEELLKLAVHAALPAVSGWEECHVAGRVGPRDLVGAAAAALDDAEGLGGDGALVVVPGGRAKELSKLLAAPLLPPCTTVRGVAAAAVSYCLARSIPCTAALTLDAGLAVREAGDAASWAGQVGAFLRAAGMAPPAAAEAGAKRAPAARTHAAEATLATVYA